MYKPINVGFVEYRTEQKGIYRIFVIAVKDIKPGEELLLDYGITYWEDIAHEEKMLDIINPLMEALEKLIGNVPKNIIEVKDD